MIILSKVITLMSCRRNAQKFTPIPSLMVMIPYLPPGVSRIRCDENTDVSTGQLRSNHTWIIIQHNNCTNFNLTVKQLLRTAAFLKYDYVLWQVISTQVMWNRCAGKIDFISLCKLLLSSESPLNRTKEQIWLRELKDVITGQHGGCR